MVDLTGVYMSQPKKLGYERYVVACAWQGMGNRLGMLVGVQVSLPDSAAHA